MVGGAPPAQAQLGEDPDHAHVVIGTDSNDCHSGVTSTTAAAGTQVQVIYCLFGINVLGQHTPIDTSGNTIDWAEVGPGSFVSVEQDTDNTGVARAVVSSTVTGSQLVSGCKDSDADDVCDPDLNKFKGSALIEWVLPDLHLAFTPTAPSGAGHDCSAGGVTKTAEVGESVEFVACVHNKDTGAPFSGASVTPTLNGPGTVSPPSTTTDGSGRATFTLSSNAIGASVVGGSVSYLGSPAQQTLNTVTNTWTAGPLNDLHLTFDDCTGGPTTSTAVVGSSSVFVACTHDQFENPVAGARVTPTTTSGPPTSITPTSGDTDSSGRVTFSMSATQTGQSVVSATASKAISTVAAQNTLTHDWTAGDLATLRLAFTPSNAACTSPLATASPVNTPTEFLACAFDGFGNRVPGAVVTPTVSSGPGSVTPGSATTDAEGTATFTVNSTEPGTTAVAATGSKGASTVSSNSVTVTWGAGALHHLHLAFTPPNGHPDACSAGPTSDSSTVGATLTFVACAHDEFNNALAGILVTPTTAGGPLATFTPASGVTGADGRVTFTASATQTGTSSISATAGSGAIGATVSLQATWTPGGAASMRLVFTPPNAGCTAPILASGEVNTPATFVACVFDSFGNAVGAGVPVTPTIQSGPGTAPPPGTTDASGRATFTFNSTKTGDSVLTATASTPPFGSSNTPTFTWTAGPIADIIMTPTGQTLAAGDTLLVSATLVDAFGNTVSTAGRPIAFVKVSGPGGYVTSTTTTNAQGTANATYRATAVGTSVLKACIDDGGIDPPLPPIQDGACNDTLEPENDQMSINWVSASLNHLHLVFAQPESDPHPCSAGPDIISTSVDSSAIFIACAQDEFDNPVAGALVTPTLQSGPPTTFTPVTGTTDANGRVTFTANATEAPTASVITATGFQNPTVLSVNTISVSWTAGAAISLTLEPVTATSTAGQTVTLTATVRDQYGNLADTLVEVTAGAIPGPNPGQPTGVPALEATGEDGIAAFPLASTNAGTSLVTATITGAEATSSVTWDAGPFDHLHLANSPPSQADHDCSQGPTAADASVDSGGPFIACAQDEFHNPVSGAVVTPSIESGPGFISPASAPTGEDGRAAFTVSHTAAPTSTVVTATATEGATTKSALNTVTVNWVAGAPEHVHLTVGTPNADSHQCSAGPSTTTAQVNTTKVLTVCVHDKFGNNVNGAAVTPTSESGPAITATPPSGLTAANGRALFDFTSTMAGTSVVIALTANGAPSINKVTATWTPGPITHAHATFSDDCHGATTQSSFPGTPQVVRFCLQDAFDNGVSSPGVRFTSTGVGSMTASQTSTDASGIARATITSNDLGQQSVRGCWDPDNTGLCDLAAIATQTWVAGPADSISVTPTANTTSASATTPQVFTVTVRDPFGHLMEDASVTFSATAIPGPNANQPFPQNQTKTTSASGQASFSVTSTNVGTSNLNFSIGQGATPTADATSNWTLGTGRALQISPSASSAGVGTSIGVTASYTDQFGNNAGAGTLVTLTASALAGPNPGQPVVASSPQATNAQGRAFFSISSSNVGTSTLTASTPGATSGNATASWFATAATSLSLQAGGPRTAGESIAVTATLTDAFGNPVRDLSVSLAGPAIAGPNPGQPTKSASPQTTNAAGNAFFTVTSTNAGTSNLLATSGSLSDNAAATWNSGPPANVSLAPEAASRTVDTSHTVSATVTDAFGNLVANGNNVAFTAAGTGFENPPSGNSTTTGGIATFSFTSTKTGTSTITATGSGSDTATVTWSSGALIFPIALDADTFASAGTSSNLNAVFEPGEAVSVAPTWANDAFENFNVTGSLTSIFGPAGGSYSIVDAAASYGVISEGGISGCEDVSNCYVISVTAPIPRPLHFEVFITEVLSTGQVKLWTLHMGASFTDVSLANIFYRNIEMILHDGITVGCSATAYCPSNAVPRWQMAIFIARAIAGSDAAVPSSGVVPGRGAYNCTGGGTSLFDDVSKTISYCKHVHYIAALDITLGCSATAYCPDSSVIRSHMAAFIARAIAGGDAAVPVSGTFTDTGSPRSYACSPAGANSHFNDVSPGDPFCRHVNYLWALGVVAGTSESPPLYAPVGLVFREAMAKFLALGFELELYGP